MDIKDLENCKASLCRTMNQTMNTITHMAILVMIARYLHKTKIMECWVQIRKTKKMKIITEVRVPSDRLDIPPLTILPIEVIMAMVLRHTIALPLDIDMIKVNMTEMIKVEIMPMIKVKTTLMILNPMTNLMIRRVFHLADGEVQCFPDGFEKPKFNLKLQATVLNLLMHKLPMMMMVFQFAHQARVPGIRSMPHW